MSNINKSGEKPSPFQAPIKSEQNEGFKSTLSEAGIKNPEFFVDDQEFISADGKTKIKAKIEKLYEMKKPIEVIATKEGGDYPSRVRREIGEKFKIEKPVHFSFNWMKLVE